MLSFTKRYSKRAKSDPWISDRIRRYFFCKRRFTFGANTLLLENTDTRTHVVGELFDTEKSYVDSLQILVNKYMKPLKSSEYMGVIEPSLVNDIFLQIPEILAHHESFLEKLRQRLTNWDTKQKVGDVFVEAV
ncbi:rho guanine nucleotide exchange factor osg-1-like isoform X2 [Tachypleus tridentatus]